MSRRWTRPYPTLWSDSAGDLASSQKENDGATGGGRWMLNRKNYSALYSDVPNRAEAGL